MKAISISSGFVQLIGSGEKTVECRTWQTNHRGEILICSNKDKIPGTIPGHALVIAKILDVRPFTRADLDAACMTASDFSPGLYAWDLETVCSVMPFPVRGLPGLFDVPDEKIHRIDESTMTEAEIIALVNDVFIPLTVGAKRQA